MKKTMILLLAVHLLVSAALGIHVGAEQNGAELIAGGETVGYESAAAALEKAEAGGVLRLLEDVREDLTVDRDLILDLNGKSIHGTVTVQSGCTLYGMDTQTDDYTVHDGNGYGRIGQKAGEGVLTGLPVDYLDGKDGYLMVTQQDGISFHRVNLRITAMTLRATVCGIYYKSAFGGDEIVAQQVESFGVALNASGIPAESNMGITTRYSLFTDFQPGEGANSGKNSTLLSNVLKVGNAPLMNHTNAKRLIYGRAYIKTQDGYMFGACLSRSFRTQVEKIDTMWTGLSATQKASVVTMYQTYSSLMGNWDIPAIKAAAQ